MEEAAITIQRWWMRMERRFVIPLTFYNHSRICSRYYIRFMMEADKKTQAWAPSHNYEGLEYKKAANIIRRWWRSLPECYDCGVKNEILGGYKPRCWACYDTKYGPI